MLCPSLPFLFALLSLLFGQTYRQSTLISNAVNQSTFNFYNSSSSVQFLFIRSSSGTFSTLDRTSNINILSCSIFFCSIPSSLVSGSGQVQMNHLNVSFQTSTVLRTLVLAEPSLSLDSDYNTSFLPSVVLTRSTFKDFQILETTGTMASDGPTKLQSVYGCTFTNVTTAKSNHIHSNPPDTNLTVCGECCLSDTIMRNCEDAYYGRIVTGLTDHTRSQLLCQNSTFLSSFTHSPPYMTLYHVSEPNVVQTSNFSGITTSTHYYLDKYYAGKDGNFTIVDCLFIGCSSDSSDDKNGGDAVNRLFDFYNIWRAFCHQTVHVQQLHCYRSRRGCSNRESSQLRSL